MTVPYHTMYSSELQGHHHQAGIMTEEKKDDAPFTLQRGDLVAVVIRNEEEPIELNIKVNSCFWYTANENSSYLDKR